MPWWSNKTEIDPEKKPEEKKDDEIELKPKDVKAKLDKIDSLDTSITELKTKTAVLDRMSSYLDEQDAAKRVAKAKELAEKVEKNGEELDELWVTDPKKAMEMQIQPLINSQINTTSLVVRKQIFDDEKFPYYHGEFAKKVDSYIDGLPITARADPATIKNCYKIVLADHMQDIADGKLKSKFAAASTTSTGNSVDIKQEKDIVLTDAQKKAARAFGYDEKTYGKLLSEEQNYV
jgi:hypothetical protein